MKRYIIHKTNIGAAPHEQGESIEEMLRRVTANKEPIPDNVPPIYTPKADGVIPDYDIRHDRFDTAIEAQNKFAASKIAQGAKKGEEATSVETEKEGKEE